MFLIMGINQAEKKLNCGNRESGVRHCSYCEFTTTQDYQFCPKCGKEMQDRVRDKNRYIIGGFT